MKKHGRFVLAMLTVTAALVLASCGGEGGSGGAQQENSKPTETAQEPAETTQAESSSAQSAGTSETTGMGGMDETTGMQGMDHGNRDQGSMKMGSGGMASQMLMENGKYSDERFIDSMVPHHKGAIAMARVASREAGHEEIKRLSRRIISSQRAEIKELRSIKEEEFGTSKAPMKMSAEQMKSMGMMDPQELAKQRPFDKAFIDAMIPHHRSAVEMANIALDKSKNAKIREIARNIVDAQEREIAQMKRWRQEWYPEG